MKTDQIWNLTCQHKVLALLLLSFFIISPVIFLIYGNREEDTSYLEIDPVAGKIALRVEQKKPIGITPKAQIAPEKRPSRAKPRKKPPAVKYGAKQVIKRAGEEARLPLGRKIHAILISPIDTRLSGGLVEVLIPKPVSFKEAVIFPAKTLLFGHFSYSGKGKSVEIRLNRGITSRGHEFRLSARAHIEGIYHSKAGSRIARSVGLAAISDIASVLTEKEALGRGRGTIVGHKSSLSNALLHATGEAARREAERQIDSVAVTEDYVTVGGETAITIRLTETFNRTF